MKKNLQGAEPLTPILGARDLRHGSCVVGHIALARLVVQLERDLVDIENAMHWVTSALVIISHRFQTLAKLL